MSRTHPKPIGGRTAPGRDLAQRGQRPGRRAPLSYQAPSGTRCTSWTPAHPRRRTEAGDRPPPTQPRTPTSCSACSGCSATGSHRASPTWPTNGFWRADPICGPPGDYGPLNAIARNKVNLQRIRTHWQDMLRVVGSPTGVPCTPSSPFKSRGTASPARSSTVSGASFAMHTAKGRKTSSAPSASPSTPSCYGAPATSTPRSPRCADRRPLHRRQREKACRPITRVSELGPTSAPPVKDHCGRGCRSIDRFPDSHCLWSGARAALVVAKDPATVG